MEDQEVWLRAWCAVASAFNSKAPDCDRYADECLKTFRARFPAAPIEQAPYERTYVKFTQGYGPYGGVYPNTGLNRKG